MLEMESFIADDIESLLRLKKGDAQRLNNIKELCENNQLISISDRKYVERLVSQYLYKKEAEESIPHEFSLPQINEKIHEPSDKEINLEENQQQLNLAEEETITTKSTTHSESVSTVDFGPRKKIVIGIAAIVLAVIVIGAVSISGTNITLDQPTKSTITSELSPPYITVITDESSYGKADIISISGESNPIIDGNVRISVENTDGKVIWAENVNVKENGEFSTLLIAGGEGWVKSGKYTLIVEHDTLKNQVTFDFIV